MSPQRVTRVAADDALTAIYRMDHDEQVRVIAARLGERLEISPPSVGAMLRRLARDGLVAVDRQRAVVLTETGHERAEAMIRRHRLAECLLVDLLGLPWWRAYEEAHLVEHALSAVTERLVIERLDHPDRSPFGYPIPGLSSCADLSHRRLHDVEAGDEVVVERVFEEDESLLRYFDESGIRPDATLRIVDRSNVLGTYTVEVAGATTTFARQVAAWIWVSEPG